MKYMTPNTSAELLAALAANFEEIAQATARISGQSCDEERQQALNRIVGLRKARRQLEAKLKSVKNDPPSVHQ
jgi:hypothetical protein